ncbi:TniQ family protein [Streptomyces sp. NPDC059917]|uniref:TniQ family protein n=1 Tax=Streptomyces sp. NPDC059917 TaxID=3347002 RepID=UPI0036665DB7
MNRLTHRMLARSLAPLPEESLPGFLLRLAYRLNQAPARIGFLCGLSGMHHRLPAKYLLALPPLLADALAHAARLSDSEVRSLTLTGSGLATAYTPLTTTHLDRGSNHASAHRRWAINPSSRFCPSCLAGDGTPVQVSLGGAWRLRWHLPVVFACLQHARLLSISCSQCGNPPNRPPGTERAGLLIQRATVGLHPSQCRQTVLDTLPSSAGTKHICGARLDQPSKNSPPMACGDLDHLLELQQRIDQRLLPDALTSDTGGTAPGHHLFPDLIATAQLIKFSWPRGADLLRSAALASHIDKHAATITQRIQQSLGPGSHSFNLWSSPEDPAECGALLLAADTLLSQHSGSDAELRDRIQPLARAAFAALPANTAAAFRRMDFSPALARALASKVNGFYRAGGHRQPKLRAPSRMCHFTAAHVPALLPSPWLDIHFAKLLTHLGPITDWNRRHLRRAASLKLVEMAAGGTWSECAEALGTPWNTAQQSLKMLKRMLASAASREAFEYAVEQVAQYLDSDPVRIDYARRRRALATWQLPDPDWAELCDGLRQFAGGRTSPNPDAATALVWAQVTNGDYLNSPAINTLRQLRQDTKHIVASVNQLRASAGRNGGKARLLRRLDCYAGRLGLACDRLQHLAAIALLVPPAHSRAGQHSAWRLTPDE